MPKAFDMDFPQNPSVVLLNSPSRETHKNAIKKSQEVMFKKERRQPTPFST
jgi:hypothetical protein